MKKTIKFLTEMLLVLAMQMKAEALLLKTWICLSRQCSSSWIIKFFPQRKKMIPR